jgi:Haemolysin-type calcium binding protein related domain
VADGGIEQVPFDDGTVWDIATLVGHIQEVLTNHAAAVANPITLQTKLEIQAWTFTVPADTFADIDAGDQLIYQAAGDDGAAVPS